MRRRAKWSTPWRRTGLRACLTGTTRHNLSKVLSIVPVYSKFTRVLTCQNLSPVQGSPTTAHHLTRTPRPVCRRRPGVCRGPTLPAHQTGRPAAACTERGSDRERERRVQGGVVWVLDSVLAQTLRPCHSTVGCHDVECNMGVVWVQTPAAGVRTYGDIMAEQQLAKARIFYLK
jgi:hypothetical protein